MLESSMKSLSLEDEVCAGFSWGKDCVDGKYNGIALAGPVLLLLSTPLIVRFSAVVRGSYVANEVLFMM